MGIKKGDSIYYNISSLFIETDHYDDESKRHFVNIKVPGYDNSIILEMFDDYKEAKILFDKIALNIDIGYIKL